MFQFSFFFNSKKSVIKGVLSRFRDIAYTATERIIVLTNIVTFQNVRLRTLKVTFAEKLILLKKHILCRRTSYTRRTSGNTVDIEHFR